MTPLRIFISSVQKEFAREREALRDYLRGDPLMRRFFDVFLFEDVPASDRRPDQLYLDEVDRCDLYIGLFGNDYGTEDSEGVSPTEREFDRDRCASLDLRERNRRRRPATEDADVDRQGTGRADPEAIQHPGRTESRALRGVGEVPGSQRIDPLGAVRCGTLHGCRVGRS